VHYIKRFIFNSFIKLFTNDKIFKKKLVISAAEQTELAGFKYHSIIIIISWCRSFCIDE